MRLRPTMLVIAAALAMLLPAVAAGQKNGGKQKPTAAKVKPATNEQIEAAFAAFDGPGRFWEKHVDRQTGQVRYLAGLHRQATNDDLKTIPDFPFLFSFNLAGTQITDAGLKELRRLTNLASLDLGRTAITDDGLTELAACKNLPVLELGQTKVTAIGLNELANIEKLAELHLDFTEIKDAGLENLAGIKNLSILSLYTVKVTDAGVRHAEPVGDQSGL